MVGVYKEKNGKYRASITFKRKHINLVQTNDEYLASQMYEDARRIIDENLTINDYSGVLPLKKWVVIINYRDNNLYIKNPIYIYKSYFKYYISKDIVLRFDKEDLFFYASHAIFMRGKQFFVNNYGIQENILKRYGLIPFAKENRDYYFVNGDNYDFTYKNIKIINKYYGVYFENNEYVVKIKNKIIGKYKDDILAAIAYNKAVDKYNLNVEKNFLDISKDKYKLLEGIVEID